jgi:hypothetical protein
MPTSFVIDKTGIIRFTHMGYSATSMSVIGRKSPSCFRSDDLMSITRTRALFLFLPAPRLQPAAAPRCSPGSAADSPTAA